jgi:ABC-type antimicrobial peptide transport system permease subunit
VSDLDWNGKDPNARPVFGVIAITHDYGRTIGWKMAEGRDFSREFPTDSGALIFNESAVKLAGLQHPIGQIIKWAGYDHAIIGVVKDMVMNSPYEPTVPTVFFLNYGWINYITIRIKRDIPTQDALAGIEKVFKKYNPDGFFDYQFTDEDYATKFAAEQRIGNLATFFAILALFISCLGLFGLASFVAEQRTKEIGVRKVLGATVFNLWKMLSKDFVVLVVISCLIAIPVSSYFLNQWLEKYAYHTQISGGVLVLAGLGALLITLLTVSYQAIRAAGINPVKSLRTE